MNKPLPYQDCVMILIMCIAVLLMSILSGCTTFEGQIQGSLYASPKGEILFFEDTEMYKPTPAEAATYMDQCTETRFMGDCDDDARRTAQNCRDLYNKRARVRFKRGLACWAVGGCVEKGASGHACVAFLTTEGWMYYDQNDKDRHRRLRKYVFWRFL